MSSWHWSLGKARLHEILLFGLLFIVDLEAPYLYSDLVRGIAVGIALASLVVMIVGRHAFLTLLAALSVYTSFDMSDRTAASLVSRISGHSMAALALAAVIMMVIRRVRHVPDGVAGLSDPSRAPGRSGESPA